jgi:hypothetical protein
MSVPKGPGETSTEVSLPSFDPKYKSI